MVIGLDIYHGTNIDPVIEHLSQKSFTMFNRKLTSKDVTQLAAFSRLVIFGLQVMSITSFQWAHLYFECDVVS